MELTEKTIKAAQPGDVLYDKKITGLYMRVFENRRGYYLYYRTKTGGQRRPKVGIPDIMTLGQAREIAKSLLLQVASGEDLMAKRKQARAAPTMAALCTKYLEEYAPKKKSAADDKAMINRVILPKLGRMRVADVQYDDIATLHRSMAKTPVHANRVLALLSRMFTLAERWEYRPQRTTPTRHVERYRENKRRRIMSPVEAAAIAAGLRKHAIVRPEAVLFIHLLVLTGARCGEVAAAR